MIICQSRQVRSSFQFHTALMARYSPLQPPSPGHSQLQSVGLSREPEESPSANGAPEMRAVRG